ncbi:reverse transcriptase [Cucumis melo var. makuwa]|uniref:Reverse transcriptase n=1 Tax=Cucumis melo var. makuwa TaxID=1194695 RepID=A0A5D3CUV0_CUCMM|nr:reverse transcriptase [Cucumis melo var. makuwa]TYK15008.1 reverse transcriptase [Cucumis melo var. makuwa]
MIVSFKTILLMSSYPLKELFTKVPMLTPLNKMRLLNEKIVTFWKLLVPLSCQLLSLPRGNAILTAAHLINCMPSRVLHFQTPLDCLKESYPSTRLIPNVPLRVFGCNAYVYNHGPNQTKFTSRTQDCVFVGYPLHQRGYKCFHPSSCKYFVIMDVTFIEDRPFFPLAYFRRRVILLPTNQIPWKTYYRRNLRKGVESPVVQTAPVQDSEPIKDQGMTDSINSHNNNRMSKNDRSKTNSTDSHTNSKADENDRSGTTVLEDIVKNHSENTSKYGPSLDLPIALRKGTRSCTKYSISNYVSYENLSPQFRAFTASLDSTTILKNSHIALECPKWKNVVMKEMKALEKNKTWRFVLYPWDTSLWDATLIYKADGTLNRHKTMLVAKEFTQSYGVDYS